MDTLKKYTFIKNDLKTRSKTYSLLDGLEEVRCPTYIGNAPCDCVAASDGLDFTCGSERTRLADIRAVVSAARFAIKTLVVTRLDPNATYIRERTFANGMFSLMSIPKSTK